jgi:hypothetical protein
MYEAETETDRHIGLRAFRHRPSASSPTYIPCEPQRVLQPGYLCGIDGIHKIARSVETCGQLTLKYTGDAGVEQTETVTADKLAAAEVTGEATGESSDGNEGEADENEGSEATE